MIPVRESSSHCLIVGGGALGLLLADALGRSPAVLRSGMRVSVQTRTPLPDPVVCEDAHTGLQCPLNIPVYAGPPTGWIAQAHLPRKAHLTLFMCVPPESVEAVTAEWLSATSSYSEYSLQCVFCNNGLLSERTLGLIAQADRRWSFLRAIFFVGAVRTVSALECRVRWTGGSRVAWGELHLSTPCLDSAIPTWLEPADSGSEQARIDFLSWSRVGDPFKVEREKFFTNLMLAAAVGPRKLPNKTLYEQTTAKFRTQLAEQFAMLWQKFSVSRESLLDNLDLTATATAANYNSLSLQAAQGQPHTMKYFLQTVESEIQRSNHAAELHFLTDWIGRLKSTWGVTA